MQSIKISPDEVSLSRMKRGVLVYGSVACVFYIIFLLAMKLFGLMHVTELRMINYVILGVVGFLEIRSMVRQSGSYVPFLGVFGAVLFTGMWSFFLFAIFLFIYAKFDWQLNELFTEKSVGVFRSVPSIILFFEGTAASIIVAFINMQYFRRYEEGEKSPRKQ